MNGKDFVGITLDEKYLIERPLGRGGMGTVYLAAHLGTGRPVAVKIIAPDFMQRTEFVERFRREARAAGRLRHPNVVDVTDFGIAETVRGSVAYLVMEYLDGCTLGEVLEEEKKLPLDWTLDILEQTCSAVGEAHRQGIIHRDLKPDNIWLEPDGRGGYTVKVLDFGIAKLEEEIEENALTSFEQNSSAAKDNFAEKTAPKAETPTKVNLPQKTFQNAAPINEGGTIIFGESSHDSSPVETNTMLESGTMLLSADAAKTGGETNNAPDFGADSNESGTTKILNRTSANHSSADGAEKKLAGASSNQSVTPSNNDAANQSLTERRAASLTRVGAILGTPLYMSPEQCRGRGLDTRADVYSLGVIAYQMLSGKTPFSGAYTEVLRAHQEVSPEPLKVKRVSRGVQRVIMLALSKDAGLRPPTAAAFAGELRSAAASSRSILQDSLTMFAANLPQFFGVTFLLSSPVIVLSIIQSMLIILNASNTLKEKSISSYTVGVLSILSTLIAFFVTLICNSLLHGAITWLIVQKMAFPMRQMRIRPALQAVRRRARPLTKTLILSSLLGAVGLCCFILPGVAASVAFLLAAPAIMFEQTEGRYALKRSVELVRRNIGKALIIGLISWVSIGGVMVIAQLLARGLFADIVVSNVKKGEVPQTANTPRTNEEENAEPNETPEPKVEINIGSKSINVSPKKPAETPEDAQRRKEERFWRVMRETVNMAIQLPLSFLVGAFFSVVISLLYIQSRLAGGESSEDLIQHFEESENDESRWKQRMQRKFMHGTRTSKSSVS